MRVIAGKARRLLLKTVPGLDTRPTTDKIKETIFNILAPYIPGSIFLDLFSGSGAIGIEALSRGAKRCVFVENDPRAVKCIEQNLQTTKLADDAVVLKKNVIAGINELSIRRILFDVVYIDPPYRAGLEEETFRALAGSGIISPDTMLILEADKMTDLDFIETSGFSIYREKIYKSNKHVFIRLNEKKPETEK